MPVDKIEKMEKVNVLDLVLKTKETWKRTTIFDIDDYFCFVTVFDGVFPFHVHDKDEFFFVVKGENELEVMDGETKKVREGCCSLTKAGSVIRSKTKDVTGVLVFHRRGISENKLGGDRPPSIPIDKSAS